MFDVFKTVNESGFTANTYFLSLAVALLCGIMTAFSASFRTRITKSFIAALVFLPAIVETVIIMVNGNIGTGVAVMGAFSLVRFRSVPGKAKEIVSVFLAMTSGLACAAGYLWVSLVITFVICVGMIITVLIPVKKGRELDLRITVPESLNFSGAFDDIFEKYTSASHLVSVKTSNMGSLYKLLYKITIKNGLDIKPLIDELRCRNGNLEIMISEAEEKSDEL